MGGENATILIVLYFIFSSVAAENQTPLNCTDTARLCTSFLAFKPSPDQSLAVVQSMFDVLQEDITVEGNGRDYIFIKKNCSCASGLNKYLTATTFTVRRNNGSVYDVVMDSYHGLAFFRSNFTRAARKGAVVSLRLMCGCSSGLWNYLMSYVMQDGDSVEGLSSRFGVSMDSIESVNGVADPDNVTVGALYYIPLNSAPGEPYPVPKYTLPSPAPSPSVDSFVGDQLNKHSHVPYWWIIGGLAVGLALIMVLLFVFSRGLHGSLAKDSDGKIRYKFQILRNTSFCCASGRSICCKSGDLNQHNGESSNRQMNIPTESKMDTACTHF